MNDIFQVPGSISKVTSMSRNNLRLQFDTMETLSAEAMKRLFELIDKPGWMTVNAHQIEAEDIINLPPIQKQENKKSPSVRFRAVLYRLWEQNNHNYAEFNDFYKFEMERLIDHYKQKLL